MTKGCTLLFNSIDIKDLNIESIREKLVGVTEQEPILIDDSIQNNITYNLDDASVLKTMNSWCKLFKIDYLLENNYKKCSELSGGEKQKIAIVRTLTKDPDVILLDEPNSALDGNSINKLKEILVKLKHEKIVIIISHDSSLSRISDEIIDLNLESIN
ncbi:ATP-binding cassette domain-containing protein [Clostridium sp. HV4-5-A1G]|uniref:ATP-binding cassette domain-containing protein n=1 Tax=Clostridium sp. HV4-5-A1G TaxID=2004595 RepID=UPI001687461C|nr:ATP-binding cassette domain-containing protein [Clostridium sp. HV4-5-A1G]